MGEGRQWPGVTAGPGGGQGVILLQEPPRTGRGSRGPNRSGRPGHMTAGPAPPRPPARPLSLPRRSSCLEPPGPPLAGPVTVPPRAPRSRPKCARSPGETRTPVPDPRARAQCRAPAAASGGLSRVLGPPILRGSSRLVRRAGRSASELRAAWAGAATTRWGRWPCCCW